MDLIKSSGSGQQTALICVQDLALSQKMRDTLQNEGLRVFEASCGQRALSLLHKYLPDVVVVSGELSGTNGYEVCQQITTNAVTANRSVMMIINGNDSMSIQKAYQYGATDFMQNPLDLSVFVQRVNHMLLTNQQIRQSEDKLAYLNKYDSLTGLANRQSFASQLNHTLVRASIRGTKAAVLLIDIDNFKRINNTLGHICGDTLLQEISRRLTLSVRSSDLLMRDLNSASVLRPELARLGGDEFTIFIEDIESVDAAITIAKRNIESISIPVQINGQEVVVTPSIGIAIFPDDGIDGSSLLKNAERAMYIAKEQGGSAYKLYDGGMNTSAKNKLKLENDLRKAISENQLDLHYQPQVDTETGKVFCLEALARWHHPELGMVPPDVFIPIAEETGLIIAIGDWVLRKACGQAKEWLEQGLPLNRIAVNVSAFQFHRADFFHKIIEALNDCNLSPQHLELELTESIIMSDAEENIEKLKLLKTIGISLAVDDFGTGYSSLSYLKSFPIDTLKIDRSFIANIAKDTKDRAIVSAIIAMADKLQLKVVAEGVEELAQSNFLEQNHCTLLQGYFFSQPKEAHVISSMIGKKFDHHIAPTPIFARTANA